MAVSSAWMVGSVVYTGVDRSAARTAAACCESEERSVCIAAPIAAISA